MQLFVIGLRCSKGEKKRKEQFEPFTSKPAWYMIEGSLQRFAFAFTFGLFAIVLTTLLWSLASWLFQMVRRFCAYLCTLLIRSYYGYYYSLHTQRLFNRL